MKEKLESRWDFIDKDENKTIIIDNVFNLITKRKYFQLVNCVYFLFLFN